MEAVKSRSHMGVGKSGEGMMKRDNGDAGAEARWMGAELEPR